MSNMNIRSANDNKIKEYISGLCKYITESVNELIRWHDEYSSDNFPLSQNVVGRLSYGKFTFRETGIIYLRIEILERKLGEY